MPHRQDRGWRLFTSQRSHRIIPLGGGWSAGTLLIVLAVLAPLVSLATHALSGSFAHWAHLADSVIARAALNTLGLLAGVGILVTCLGTGAAWLVSAYEFPSRKVLTWALLLPLAVPTLHHRVCVSGLVASDRTGSITNS